MLDNARAKARHLMESATNQCPLDERQEAEIRRILEAGDREVGQGAPRSASRFPTRSYQEQPTTTTCTPIERALPWGHVRSNRVRQGSGTLYNVTPSLE